MRQASGQANPQLVKMELDQQLSELKSSSQASNKEQLD